MEYCLINSLYLCYFKIRDTEFQVQIHLIADKDSTDNTNDLWNSEKISSVWWSWWRCVCHWRRDGDSPGKWNCCLLHSHLYEQARLGWATQEARWHFLASSESLSVSSKKVDSVLLPYNEFFTDQDCLVKMSGYIVASFFSCVFMDLKSISPWTQKKNLATLQPC